jgi:FkbM family methyltransferase
MHRNLPRKRGAEMITCGDLLFRKLPKSTRAVYTAEEYWMDDILPEDIVVDIGANVGAFCVRAARRSRRVLAVEPLMGEALRESIRLNAVPVGVLEVALGDGTVRHITWGGRSAVLQTSTLGNIIRVAGGCDFLKCDCEGAEWCIRPGDLDEVRRIEMELHMPPIGGPVNRALLEYIGAHYDFVIDRKPYHDVRGVLGVLHAVRKEGTR